MKFIQYILTSIFVVFFTRSYAQESDFILFGGNNIEEGRSILETPDGGYIISGRTRSFGSGSDDYYFIKINKFDDILAEKAFGGPHHDRCQSVISLGDGLYGLFGQSWDFLGGNLNYNMTVVNTFGDLVERKLIYRTKRDIGLKVINTSDNNFVMVGSVQNIDGFGQMHILKANQNMEIIWENDFGNFGRKDYAYDVLENEAGYLLIGTYSGFYGMYATFPDFQEKSDLGIIQLDFDGNVVWNYKYEGDDFDFGYSVCQIDNFIFALGATKSEGEGSFDILLLKLDSEGNLLDSFTYGGDRFEYGYKIIADSEDNLVIAGVSQSEVETPSLYVLKLTTQGDIIFEKRYEESNAVVGYDIIESSDGNYIITGTYTINDTDKDAFLLKIDTAGNIVTSDTNIRFPDKPISIYPNPAIGNNVTISTFSKEILISFIEIYDALGQRVRRVNVANQSYKINLYIGELTGGYYVLNIGLNDGSKHVEKLIIY